MACCNQWDFLINPEKCMYQIYTYHWTFPQISLHICNQTIAFSSEQQVLGVSFDCPCLNFAAHIKSIWADCLKRLNVLRALSSLRWGPPVPYWDRSI
jgi:hypothetical protein